MRNYNSFKNLIDSEFVNNTLVPLVVLINKIQPGGMTEKEVKDILHVILKIKDKTDEDLFCLLSKFKNMRINGFTLPMYLLSYNKDQNFNLSPNQSVLLKCWVCLKKNIRNFIPENKNQINRVLLYSNIEKNIKNKLNSSKIVKI